VVGVINDGINVVDFQESGATGYAEAAAQVHDAVVALQPLFLLEGA